MLRGELFNQILYWIGSLSYQRKKRKKGGKPQQGTNRKKHFLRVYRVRVGPYLSQLARLISQIRQNPMDEEKSFEQLGVP